MSIFVCNSTKNRIVIEFVLAFWEKVCYSLDKLDKKIAKKKKKLSKFTKRVVRVRRRPLVWDAVK